MARYSPPKLVPVREPRRWHWPEVWRDVDGRSSLGIDVWTTGCQVNIGRRMYRAKWGER